MDSVEKRGTTSKTMSKGIRRSYDANFKVIVANYAIQTNNCQAARKYGVIESNVRNWRADLNRLKNANSSRKSFRGPKKGRFHEVERLIVDFIREKRNEGMPISRDVIRLKAQEVAREQNIPRTSFKASNGWCVRMMRRCGLSLRRRTSLAQRLPKDFEEKLVAFQRHVIALRKSHDYLCGQMGNGDETAVYFDMPSNTTVEEKGAKSVIVRTTGNEKVRVTVMLAVLADGRKLPPFVILKRKTIPKEKFPSDVIIRCQEKGWMTSDLMGEWLRLVWNRRPGALLKKRGMLVLDAFRGHLTPDIKGTIRDMNTDLVIIPGGMTSQLQVLDVVVNKPFKDHLRQQYSDWLLAGNHSLTPTGKIKKPSIQQLAGWISTAWQRITPESIVRGFKKCFISNAMDGSEDDVCWKDAAGSDASSSSSSSSSGSSVTFSDDE